MEYAELLQQVQAAADLDRATAERVTWATMVMLAEVEAPARVVGAGTPDELRTRGGRFADLYGRWLAGAA